MHTENYLGGGPAPRALARVRGEHAVSLHGVGLSLGSADGLDRAHLARVAELTRRIEPALVSEHLSWSIAGGAYLNHLLPLPYTEESLGLVARNVSRAQEALGRPLLIENPSSYLRFRHSPIPEPEFLSELVRRTGCGLLCDVNNVFVSCRNFDRDPAAYLDALHAAIAFQSLDRFGPRPTLIEWDTDVPALAVLLGEARRAEAAIARAVATGGPRAVAA